MRLRCFVVLALLLGVRLRLLPLSSCVFHRASCTVVRYYVAKYSVEAAESWLAARAPARPKSKSPGAAQGNADRHGQTLRMKRNIFDSIVVRPR